MLESIGLELLARIGKKTAIEGAGDPTYWGFYEFTIPEEVKELQKAQSEQSCE